MLTFSSHFFICCKISIEPVIFRQKMAACWIRRIHHDVINILMELSNSVSESSLLNHFSVSHLISFFSCPWLNICKLNHWLTLSSWLMATYLLQTIIVKIVVLIIILVAACLVILIWVLSNFVLLLHHLQILLLLHLLLMSHLLLLIHLLLLVHLLLLQL